MSQVFIDRTRTRMVTSAVPEVKEKKEKQVPGAPVVPTALRPQARDEDGTPLWVVPGELVNVNKDGSFAVLHGSIVNVLFPSKEAPVFVGSTVHEFVGDLSMNFYAIENLVLNFETTLPPVAVAAVTTKPAFVPAPKNNDHN